MSAAELKSGPGTTKGTGTVEKPKRKRASPGTGKPRPLYLVMDKDALDDLNQDGHDPAKVIASAVVSATRRANICLESVAESDSYFHVRLEVP